MKTVTTIGLDIAKRWRVDGPDQLVVISGDGETAAEVMLRLDSEGRIDGAFAPDRPRSATAPILPTPWRGGLRLSPSQPLLASIRREVASEINGKEEVYWQGCIET